MTRNTIVATEPAFIAIDYSKAFLYVTVGDEKGKVLEHRPVDCNEESVSAFFARFSPRSVRVVVESCRGYEWLLDLLKSLKFKVDLANTREIKKRRCKTDKVDSRILMELQAKDYLPTCYQANPRERRDRELIRARYHNVKTLIRYKQRVHSLLDKENKGFQDPFTFAGRQKLQDIELSSPRDEILRKHLEVIDYLEQEIAEATRAIRKLARYNPDVCRLKKLPGFDVLTAMAFVSEVGDITRFSKAKQVAAFLGLVPRVYSSGDVTRMGRITKEGPPMLRRLLVQNAWNAIRASENLRIRFTAIARRRGRKVAIVAIARRLVEIAFHILKYKQDYDESKLDAGLVRSGSCSPTMRA